MALSEGSIQTSTKAIDKLSTSDLFISPIVCLELQYLYEIKRIKVTGEKITRYLEKTISLKICDLPFEKVINEACLISWTRDPFDRIITAHAAFQNAFLITCDEVIQNYYHKALG
jgi:PIN domain nuclease of toxin-antitoxin system